MTNETVKAGTLVTHPRKPEWGPGKVVKIEADSMWVFWRDAADNVVKKFSRSAVQFSPAASQSDPMLDNLPPLLNPDGTVAALPRRLSLGQAVEKFLSFFPAGFYDPKYI